MKNAIIALLAISIIGLGAYAFRLKMEIADAGKPQNHEEAAKPEPQSVKTDDTDSDLLDLDADEPVGPEAKHQLKKANKLITQLYQQNKSLEKEMEPSFAKGLAQMMESPEFQGLARQGIERNIKTSHAGLFRWLNLDPEKEAALTELLIERNMADIPNGMNWMMGDFEEAADNMVAAREEMYKQVEELLGKDQLEVYKYWEESKNEREAVQRFNYSLGEEQKLNDERSDKLVEMMYVQRGEFEELDHLSRPENFDPREMTPERRDDIMGQVEDMHKVFVKEAEPILEPEVLPKYEANLAVQRRRLRGFMEFSHGVATGAAGENQPDAPVPETNPDAIKLR